MVNAKEDVEISWKEVVYGQVATCPYTTSFHEISTSSFALTIKLIFDWYTCFV